MERYGDYNEIDESPKKRASVVMIILKSLTALCILGVVGILAFRMILFNIYPESVSSVYFNDTLADYYNETSGNIGALTQTLRAPYDDENVANFMCDKLVVVRGAGQLQITVRYNESNLDDIAAKAGVDAIDPDDADAFYFRLCVRYEDGVMPNASLIGEGSDKYEVFYYNECTRAAFENMMMYRYQRLVFDGIEFFEENEEKKPIWIRLEVFVKGQSSEEPFSAVAIYEDHEDFHKFEDYSLSSEEKPQ